MSKYIPTTSHDTLFKMAQAAAQNSTLLAHFIEKQCQQKNITWAQLALDLQVSQPQLARLALCRQPGSHQFKEDVAQAAKHANIDEQILTRFLQPASNLAFIKKFFRPKRPSLSNTSRKGDPPMMIKRALAFGVALIAIFFMSAFIFSQPANTDATLRVTSGEVVVQQTSLLNQATNTVVSAGETLTVSSNDTIEVPANAAAELYMFEGSVVSLSENTVLELTELANNGSDHQIYMTLFNGHIINRVTKLLGVNDAYEVRTPSSTASVRGTVFSVEVLNENAAMVNVTEGVVEVNLGNEVAQVNAGEMITAVSGQPLNVEPSNNPEMRPTAAPTQEPTEEPTGEPTGQPTDTPEADAVEGSEEDNEANGNRPEDTPGNENGNRPATPPGQDKENGNNGNSPDTVPGNTPEGVPGNGNPPASGGTPPGQENNPNNGTNNGNNGNTDNQGSDNADAGSGNADNGGDNGVGNDGSNNGNTDNQGSDNADAGSGNADNGGGNDDNNGSDNADNGSGNSDNGNGGSGNGNNGNGKP